MQWLKNNWTLILIIAIVAVYIFWSGNKTNKIIEDNKKFIEKKEMEYQKALSEAGIKVISKETIKYLPKEKEDPLLIEVDRERTEFKFKLEDANKALAKSIKKIDISPWAYAGFIFNRDTFKFGVETLIGTDLQFWIHDAYIAGKQVFPDNTFAVDVGIGFKPYDSNNNIGLGLKLGGTIKIK
jgi:hypothetical protein